MTNPDESAKDSPAGFTNESSGGPDWAAVRPDWAAVRPIYERDLTITLDGICSRFGVNRRALQKKIEQEGWTPRRPRKTHRERAIRPKVSGRALIKRMMGVLERHVTRLENEDMPPTDKEAVLLGNMSRTLGKLMDLDKAKKEQGGSATKAQPTTDLEALRKKIAERIDQLNQG